jgi:hypothetical protein
VIAITSGTLNISGMNLNGPVDAGVGVTPSLAVFSATPGLIDVYSGVSGPAQFGSGSGRQASSSSGNSFYLFGGDNRIGVSSGYLSGQSINSTTLFSGATFASLGLTLGTFVFTTPADTVTVQIGASAGAVPEPATWAMFLLGFGAVGYSMRRREVGYMARRAPNHRLLPGERTERRWPKGWRRFALCQCPLPTHSGRWAVASG